MRHIVLLNAYGHCVSCLISLDNIYFFGILTSEHGLECIWVGGLINILKFLSIVCTSTQAHALSSINASSDRVRSLKLVENDVTSAIRVLLSGSVHGAHYFSNVLFIDMEAYELRCYGDEQ